MNRQDAKNAKKRKSEKKKKTQNYRKTLVCAVLPFFSCFSLAFLAPWRFI